MTRMLLGIVGRFGRLALLAVVLGALVASTPAAAQDDLAGLQAEGIARCGKELKSRDVEKRRAAAESLGGYGRPEGVPLLVTALSDSDAGVREKAAGSLWRLEKVAAPAAGPLRQALSDPDAAVRVRAAGALEAIGVDPTELVAARRSVLQQGDWFDVALAARDLVGQVTASELVGPLLEAIRRTPPAAREGWSDPEEHFSGVSVLKPLAATNDRGVIGPLQAALAEPGMPRAALVQALSELDPEPDGWVATLVGATHDPDARVRLAAAAALERRAKRPDGGAGWPEQVLPLLDDRDPDVVVQAVEAFGAAGGHASGAAPRVARLVEAGTDERLRLAAIRALGRVGDTAEPFDRAAKTEVAKVAAPVLLKVVDSNASDDLRVEAMESFTRLALEPAAAVRELSRIAEGRYPSGVRTLAVRAFWPLGRDAEPALPALERLQRDPEPLIASAAELATRSIKSGLAVQPQGSSASAVTAAVTPPGGQAAMTWLRTHELQFTRDEFYRALTESNAEAVEAYLDAGMSASDAGTSGMPPLHHALMFACHYGERPTSEAARRIVGALLQHGADPNALDEQGNAALHRAAGSCDAVVIRQLIAAGAKVNALNRGGSSAFTIALVTDPEAAEAMLKAGFHFTPTEAAGLADWLKDEPAKRRLLERAGVK